MVVLVLRVYSFICVCVFLYFFCVCEAMEAASASAPAGKPPAKRLACKQRRTLTLIHKCGVLWYFNITYCTHVYNLDNYVSIHVFETLWKVVEWLPQCPSLTHWTHCSDVSGEGLRRPPMYIWCMYACNQPLHEFVTNFICFLRCRGQAEHFWNAWEKKAKSIF